MSCHDNKNLMMGYLDDELDDEQKKAFEEHLGGCDDCRKELGEFRLLKQITDEVALAGPEDEVWEHYWGGVDSVFNCRDFAYNIRWV